MKIIVGSKNPVKVNASRVALQKVLGEDVSLDVTGVDAPSLVADQPMTEAETRLGAVNRVKACLAAHQADWYVAIEGGVDNFTDGPATFAYIAICNGEQWSVGRSTNLPLPGSVYAALTAGEELGDVMDRLFNTDNIKQKGGAIGLLTNHLATRQSVYELAIILAMARFNHPALFNR
ncbi:inosine/xanthosine triphosphatase [Alteromonas lipolytica]|uniref:Inosine/xanthosine triphosphatase n=1 Tax=Alteromonas lipolytica TaxID=1856405 RepID=A0A1E8FC61_9ALTE|nr:inosine/xanthosine triphosphatase [Alteromonas lipolytica]OFI33093.1 inosine/xanthosine triphosphatase [Alteromonas lipolytica]GGF62564.1 non-canonical purine NTP phosphatase [Alteromonas lipolytica]